MRLLGLGFVKIGILLAEKSIVNRHRRYKGGIWGVFVGF
jgi:hypothetical protein